MWTSTESDPEHCIESSKKWRDYTSSGVDPYTMITELFQTNLSYRIHSSIHSLFTGAFALPPGPNQQWAFVAAANTVLRRFYEQNPPSEEKPAIVFVYVRRDMEDTEDGGEEESSLVLAVLRSEWEKILHLDEWASPSLDRLTKLFPMLVLATTSPSLPGQLLRKRSTVDDFDDKTLRLLGIYPPDDIIISVVAFDLHYTPLPDPLSSPASPPDHASLQPLVDRKRSRSTSSDCRSQSNKQRRVSSSSSRVPANEEDSHSQSGESMAGPSDDVSVEPIDQASKPATSPLDRQLFDEFYTILCDSRHRFWVCGATVGNNQVHLSSCDCEGVIKSSPIDVRSPHGVQLLCKWIVSLASRTMEQWGFTRLFGQIGKPIGEIEFDIPDTNVHLSFGPLRYQQPNIFGRNTNVYDTTVTTGDLAINSVCKIAWPLTSGSNESDLIQKARSVDPVHVPDVHYTVDVVTDPPSRKLRKLCDIISTAESRTMRIIVMTKYQPIDQLEGLEFLDAFTQIMKCNAQLVEAGSVHHRDLSPGSMMYHRDGEGGVIGVLTNFGLVISLDTPSMNPSKQVRYGTAPFMARSLLLNPKIEPTLVHDYESALYILTWVAMGYKNGRPPSETQNPLRRWTEDTWNSIAWDKVSFITEKWGYETIVDKIRPEYSCLVRPIEELRYLALGWYLAELMKSCRFSVEVDGPRPDSNTWRVREL